MTSKVDLHILTLAVKFFEMSVTFKINLEKRSAQHV